MNNKNYQVEKLCGFYVSDWHLTTTILPYINSKIDEKTKVITILENNIEENIKVLMEKLNICYRRGDGSIHVPHMSEENVSA